jgi:hypothetical protein
MRGFIALLFTGLVALVAGTIGYQAGAASTVAAGSGLSFLLLAGLPHLFGFLFFLLVIGFFVSMVAGRRHRWAGHGPMGIQGGPGRFGPMGGPGRHGQMDENDPRRQWVAEAHRHLHEADAARTASAAAGATTPRDPSTGPAAG